MLVAKYGQIILGIEIPVLCKLSYASEGLAFSAIVDGQIELSPPGLRSLRRVNLVRVGPVLGTRLGGWTCFMVDFVYDIRIISHNHYIHIEHLKFQG